MAQPRILTIDIETAPVRAAVWGLWDQNVGLNQIEADWSILSYSAKWLGEDGVYYEDTFNQRDQRNDRKLCKGIWKLLDKADIVIGQNHERFDVKKLNSRFIAHGMPPPSPFRCVDTLKVAKRHFGFTSNKLEYMTERLCTKYKKLKHGRYPGYELWAAFLARDVGAQIEMREYNEQDVRATEELYLIMRPWIKGHPNVNLYTQGLIGSLACPNCGSNDLRKKGYRYTQLGKYQRYLCNHCGAWPHGRKALITKEDRENLLGNVA
jgi:hypothetical protein